MVSALQQEHCRHHGLGLFAQQQVKIWQSQSPASGQMWMVMTNLDVSYVRNVSGGDLRLTDKGYLAEGPLHPECHCS